MGKQVGIGGFSSVYKCTHLKSKEERAVKVIDKVKIKGKIEELDREFKILMDLDHPNIIKIFEIFETNNLIFIVQEFCKGGELCKEIANNQKKGIVFTEEDASKIIRQIASSLIYLHSFNICHGDIKPENIMLKNPNDFTNVKLIDFGFSKRLQYGEVVSSGQGTVGRFDCSICTSHQRSLWGTRTSAAITGPWESCCTYSFRGDSLSEGTM